MGTVGARYMQDGCLSVTPSLDESRHRLAAVAGTSTCHLVQVGLHCFPFQRYTELRARANKGYL